MHWPSIIQDLLTRGLRPVAAAPGGPAAVRNALPRRSARSFWPVLTLLVVLVSRPAPVYAQDQPPPQAPAPAPVPADTLADEGPPRSPRGAFFRSLVVPGWGQAWVGSPGRGGVYFALEAGAVWMTFKSRRKLREARAEEAWLHATGQLPAGQPFGLVRSREDQVEDWTTLAVFLLFFAGADAWVSAHLADFGERVGVVPEPDGGLRLQVTVPVGGRE